MVNIIESRVKFEASMDPITFCRWKLFSLRLLQEILGFQFRFRFFPYHLADRRCNEKTKIQADAFAEPRYRKDDNYNRGLERGGWKGRDEAQRETEKPR